MPFWSKYCICGGHGARCEPNHSRFPPKKWAPFAIRAGSIWIEVFLYYFWSWRWSPSRVLGVADIKASRRTNPSDRNSIARKKKKNFFPTDFPRANFFHSASYGDSNTRSLSSINCYRTNWKRWWHNLWIVCVCDLTCLATWLNYTKTTKSGIVHAVAVTLCQWWRGRRVFTAGKTMTKLAYLFVCHVAYPCATTMNR